MVSILVSLTVVMLIEGVEELLLSIGVDSVGLDISALVTCDGATVLSCPLAMAWLLTVGDGRTQSAGDAAHTLDFLLLLHELTQLAATAYSLLRHGVEALASSVAGSKPEQSSTLSSAGGFLRELDLAVGFGWRSLIHPLLAVVHECQIVEEGVELKLGSVVLGPFEAHLSSFYIWAIGVPDQLSELLEILRFRQCLFERLICVTVEGRPLELSLWLFWEELEFRTGFDLGEHFVLVPGMVDLLVDHLHRFVGFIDLAVEPFDALLPVEDDGAVVGEQLVLVLLLLVVEFSHETCSLTHGQPHIILVPCILVAKLSPPVLPAGEVRVVGVGIDIFLVLVDPSRSVDGCAGDIVTEPQIGIQLELFLVSIEVLYDIEAVLVILSVGPWKERPAFLDLCFVVEDAQLQPAFYLGA